MLILLRHGQSQWNLENRFTGWWDVDLTAQGVAEARAAGELLQAKDCLPDVAFTSLQTRAIRTLHLALETSGRLWVAEYKDWRLNERHYGGLTGRNKAETTAEHGAAQVQLWRRGYDTLPPPLVAGSRYDLVGDLRYATSWGKSAGAKGAGRELGASSPLPAILKSPVTSPVTSNVPASESLKDVVARVVPYYQAVIEPLVQRGQRVLVAAHGNSLRALVKHLSAISDEEITKVEIPTGQPLLYDFDEHHRPTKRYYLADK